MTFEIKSKVSRQGRRAGSTLYYAYPMKRPKLKLKDVERRISESCSLSAPDVRAALVAFAEIVCASLEEGRMSASERREQLIDVARHLFAQKGFEGTSIEEIASRAKVSKPVVYKHYYEIGRASCRERV